MDPDPEADDFQNLISSSLTICGKIFTKIHSEGANRQTDEQTNARHYITSFAEVKK